MRRVPEGVGVALVSPTTPQDELDLVVFDDLVDYVVRSGIDFVQPGAASGQVLQLTDREYAAQLDHAVTRCAGTATMVTAHPGRPDTAWSVRLTREAYRLGVDAMWLMAPTFSKPDDAGLLLHYSRVIEAADEMGVVLYNNTAAAGVEVPLHILETLAVRFPEQVVAVMQSDAARYLETVERFRGRLPVFPGSEADLLHVVALAGPGTISFSGNVIAAELVEIHRAAIEGRFDAARELLLDCAPLIAACRLGPAPAVLKYLLRGRGWAVGYPRSPLADVPADIAQRADAAFAALAGRGIPVGASA